MPRNLLVLLGGSLSAAVLAASGLAATSHVLLFENHKGNVFCGPKIHPPKQRATLVLCSGPGIPKAPKHAIGDPFVQIGRTGRPQVVLLTENSFVARTGRKVANGTKWSLLGVKCTVGSTTRCVNKSGHGFTLGGKKLKTF